MSAYMQACGKSTAFGSDLAARNVLHVHNARVRVQSARITADVTERVRSKVSEGVAKAESSGKIQEQIDAAIKAKVCANTRARLLRVAQSMPHHSAYV